MNDFAFFSATLGLPRSWSVAAMSLDRAGRRLDMTLRAADGHTLACPICGAPGRAQSTAQETWFHQNYFDYNAFLHVSMPLFDCRCGASFPLDRPWSRPGSRFVRLQ